MKLVMTYLLSSDKKHVEGCGNLNITPSLTTTQPLQLKKLTFLPDKSCIFKNISVDVLYSKSNTRHNRGPSQYVARGWGRCQSQPGVGHHQCPVSQSWPLYIVESSSRSFQLISRRCGGNFSHPWPNRGLFWRIILRHPRTRIFSIGFLWRRNNWWAHGVTYEKEIYLHFATREIKLWLHVLNFKEGGAASICQFEIASCRQDRRKKRHFV